MYVFIFMLCGETTVQNFEQIFWICDNVFMGEKNEKRYDLKYLCKNINDLKDIVWLTSIGCA